MRSIRERASDALLRTTFDRAVERRELERGIAATPSDAPGYAAASEAVLLAEWVDDALLWLGWRLRPRTAFPAR
jgi:hypothetical protein